jgi:hypothetical protein
MVPVSADRARRTDGRPECAACARLTTETLIRRQGLGHTALRPRPRAHGVGGEARRRRFGGACSCKAVLRHGTGFRGGPEKDFGGHPALVTRLGLESDRFVDSPPHSVTFNQFIRSGKDDGTIDAVMHAGRRICSPRRRRCEYGMVDFYESRHASRERKVSLAWVTSVPQPNTLRGSFILTRLVPSEPGTDRPCIG